MGVHELAIASQIGAVAHISQSIYVVRRSNSLPQCLQWLIFEKSRLAVVLLSAGSHRHAGLNFTSVRSGVTSSKCTATGIPTFTRSGAATILVVIRGPSSSSTIAST